MCKVIRTAKCRLANPEYNLLFDAVAVRLGKTKKAHGDGVKK
jgi:hypothetical protein